MSIILNIDTASPNAFVCISREGICLHAITNENQKDHAAFLHTAIQDILNALKINIKDIDAIAVNTGPGSYTGLRVGMASAKGLCFALKKPLISINALELIANTVVNEMGTRNNMLICPMIDARRMEVYTALYNADGQQLEAPHALILNELSFKPYLDMQPVIFSGDGAEKFLIIISHANAITHIPVSFQTTFCKMTHKCFEVEEFTDLAYSEPSYIKDFHDNSTVKKKSY